MKIEGSKLLTNEFELQFNYDIKDVKICNGVIVVLLNIPRGNDEINNIYGVNSAGEVIWRVQSPLEAFKIDTDTQGYKYYEKSIYVGMVDMLNKGLEITTFSGMKYILDCNNGTLLAHQASRW